jgi:hypothetical protein
MGVGSPAKAREHARRGTWGRTPIRYRLLGFRIVERTPQTLVIRLPWYLAPHQSVIGEAISRSMADADIAGVRVKITHGHRLVKIRRETDAC